MLHSTLVPAFGRTLSHAQLNPLPYLLLSWLAGELPMHHGLARDLHALVHSLPALSTSAFARDAAIEQNDTLAAIYLSAITQVCDTQPLVVYSTCIWVKDTNLVAIIV
jgi:hypothetical protein